MPGLDTDSAADFGSSGVDLVEPAPRVIDRARSRGDRAFRAVAAACGMSSLVILALIALFLITKSIDPIREAGFKFFTEFRWQPDSPDDNGKVHFGIGAVLFGTVAVAVISLIIAVPIALGAAIYVNEYAPRRLRKVFTTVIDLLAAVPSLIFALWGLYWLQPHMKGMMHFLATKLHFIPIFRTRGILVGNSMFMTGVVLALMIVPIITSVSREVMSQVPRVNCEAALALGGTRWGMVRNVILPFGRSGIIGAAMLGLGRALGETIVAATLLSPVFDISIRILQPGGNSVAALIANNFGQAGDFERQALIAAGMALFILTLFVNAMARLVVARSGSSKGLDL